MMLKNKLVQRQVEIGQTASHRSAPKRDSERLHKERFQDRFELFQFGRQNDPSGQLERELGVLVRSVHLIVRFHS